MKMRARVRVTEWLDLDDVDVPELQLEQIAEGRSGQRATNEPEVLAARAAAAERAEQLALERYPDADLILVEEVTEATA